MEQDKQFLAAMIIPIFAVCLMLISSTARAADLQAMEKCFGVVKAGQNDCDTSNGQCAVSAVDASPTDWIYLPNGVCNKLVGGMTAPGTSAGNSPTSNATPSSTKSDPVQSGNSIPQPGNSPTSGSNDGMNTSNTQ